MQTDPSCDRCGRPAVAEADEESLCVDCYHEAGSCCGISSEEDVVLPSPHRKVRKRDGLPDDGGFASIRG